MPDARAERALVTSSSQRLAGVLFSWATSLAICRSWLMMAPVELYKFCTNLQNVFLKDLAGSFVGTVDFNLGDVALKVLTGVFGGPTGVVLNGLFPLCMLIGLSYCVLKVFFSNIKRGGILLIQMAVGTLYLFSVPRGYTDGFNQWCKQIIALCLTDAVGDPER